MLNNINCRIFSLGTLAVGSFTKGAHMFYTNYSIDHPENLWPVAGLFIMCVGISFALQAYNNLEYLQAHKITIKQN